MMHDLAAAGVGQAPAVAAEAGADGPGIVVRAATEGDQPAIRVLVRGERLNPTGLHWPNFLIADDGSGPVGAVQMRRHPDGSRELGSLVVSGHTRNRGIATRLIDALLAAEPGRVLMITGADFAAHYERWGFRCIDPAEAPAAVRRNFRFGQAAGAVRRFLRQPRRQLVVLERRGEFVCELLQ